MPNRRAHPGNDSEGLARQYLEQRGLRTLATNYRSRWGELDIVMEDGSQIVFVEVRYRADSRFGGAAASVTRNKQERLLRTAAVFLEQRALAHRPARFDIVAISGSNTVDWLINAFGLQG